MSSTDEIAWAFRKLLEAVAAEGPVVAVFDDIQWGEDVFLDLLEHVAFLSTGAPILLLCMARPELLDRRGGWGGVLRLQPLDRDEAEELMEARIGGHELPAEVRERILRRRGRQPAVRRGDGGDGSGGPTTARSRCRRRSRRCSRRGSTSSTRLSARCSSAARRRRGVPPGRRPGAHAGGASAHGSAHRARPQGADPPRTGRCSPARTRSASATSSCATRPTRPAEGGAGGTARAVRRLAPRARRRAGRARRAGRLPPRAGVPLPPGAGTADATTQALAARAGERLVVAGSRARAPGLPRWAHLLERAADLLPDELRNGRFEVDLGWARFNAGQVGEDAVIGSR